MINNLASIINALAIDIIYCIGTQEIGAIILKKLNFKSKEIKLFSFLIGYSFVSIIMTFFIFLNLHVRYSVIIIYFILSALFFFKLISINYVVIKNKLQGLKYKILSINIFNIIYLFIIILLLLYIFINTYIESYGGDLTIYHLIIPRDLINDNGYEFNKFFIGEGISKSWHVFGVPVYYFGGPKAYLGLVFIVVVFFLYHLNYLFDLTKDSILKDNKLLFYVLLLFTLIIFLRDSIANNDIALVYFEFCILIYAILISSIHKSSIYLFGIVLGVILSIKLTSLSACFIICIFYIFKNKLNIKEILIVIFPILFIGLFWPIVNIFNYGSPLPFTNGSINFLGFSWLPQMIETNKIIENIHGRWLLFNTIKFLSFPFILILVLISANLFLLKEKCFINISNKVKSFLKVICAYVLLRYLFLIFISPRFDIIFHDRYHLISFLLFTLSGLYIWIILFKEKKLFNIITLLLLLIGIFSNYKMIFPDGDGITEAKQMIVPSIFRSIINQYQNGNKSNYFESDDIINYLNSNVPISEKIATTKINTYIYNRKVIQLLPNAQNSFDYSKNPESLIAQLKYENIKYIHLTTYGLVPGASNRIHSLMNNLYLLRYNNNVTVVIEHDSELLLRIN